MKTKLLYLLLLGFIVNNNLSAQIFFTEDFSNQALPGWRVANNTSSAVVWQWSNDPTSAGQYSATFNGAGAAGGHIIVDSDNSGVAGTPEYTTITSSKINCAGKPAVVLKFTEFYRAYASDSGHVYISNDSVNWVKVRASSDFVDGNGRTPNPNFVSINISSTAANQDSVYIRFSWWGSYDYYWFIDDVSLTVPDNVDGLVEEVNNTLSNGCQLTANEPIKILFTNNGIQTLDSCFVNYQINGGAVVSEKVVLPTPLAFGESFNYTFSATADFNPANVYGITAWIDLLNDNTHDNDTAFSVAISAATSSVPYQMGFEIPDAGNEIGGYTWLTEDANQDDFGWFFSDAKPHGGDIHYRYEFNGDGQTAADDWLYSPCISLDASKAYKVSFYTEVGEDDNGLYEENLELKYGNANNSSAMTLNIKDFGSLNNSAYERKSAGFKPASSGTYYVGFHCYSDADKWFLDIDDVQIDELLPPTAAFTVAMSGNIATVTDGSSDAITNWTWKWGDGTTSPGQIPGPHTYSAPGTYTVCVVVTNLAGVDSTCQTVTISGINEADASAQISVFPNPTNRYFSVMMNDVIISEATIEIVNVVGETMISRTTKANNMERFDMSKFAPGVYYVRITSNELKAVKKFVYTK